MEREPDHELTLVEMVIPRKGGVDGDATRPPTPKNSPNARRLTNQDRKLADPQKRDEFNVALLTAVTVAIQSIKKMYSVTSPDQTNRQKKQTTHLTQNN